MLTFSLCFSLLQKGNTRVDAALDAMSPYGFSEELVEEKVRELLNVYGGDVGWIFIEEFSYSLLLDYILAQQEGDSSAASAIGPQSGVRLPLCTNSKVVDAVSQTIQALDPASQINKDLDTALITQQAANSGGGGETPHMTHNQRRKPYNGWISNDDVDDVVHLTPAPLQESLQKMLTPAALQESFDKLFNGMNSGRKRKTGWDVRPQDM